MRWLAVLAALILTPQAQATKATEQVDTCLTYKNSGKAYRVQARKLSGVELNRATRTMAFAPLSQYVVAFWGEGQATIIEMTGLFLNIGPFVSSGIDQEGRPWEVQKYSPLSC